jgi:hypothetical protein
VRRQSRAATALCSSTPGQSGVALHLPPHSIKRRLRARWYWQDAPVERSTGNFCMVKPKGKPHFQTKLLNSAPQQIRERINEIAALVTAIHPLVPKLADPPTEGELFKALYELTKQVEVVKKHLLKLEKRDDSALL